MARADKEYRYIRLRREGRITVITINRPERMNALHREAQQELAHAFDAFSHDSAQCVVILTGEGPRAFCAGLDLKALVEDGPSEASMPATGFGGLTYRFDLHKPVIAAVNGACVGGGFELALACDLIIAADHARFGFPEPRVGTAALSGGIQRLSRQIGLKRALDLILTARLTSAREGFEAGFVTAVSPSDLVLPIAFERARMMLDLSPAALRASKQAAMEGLDQASLQSAIDHQRDIPAVRELRRSTDRSAGPRAFVDGSSPLWNKAD